MGTKKFFYITIFIVLILTCVFPFATASEVEYVYLGGIPVGITMDDPGLSICGKCEVITQNGADMPSLSLEIIPGDYLVSINGKGVNTLRDVAEVLEDVKEGEKVKLGIQRGDETIYFYLTPSLDVLTKKLKLGLMIQEDLTGVGTLTYYTKDGKFGALGHSVSGDGVKLQQGKLYDCKIIGIKRPRSGEAGELQGVFDRNSAPIAKVLKNNDYGIFGEGAVRLKNLPEVRVGNRYNVKEGKAYIYTCVNGTKSEKYEVEIVKAYKQSSPSVKSMVISVTDERLIKKTGGILQGMSGSPIVQNGRLVGAVTHVFTGDATKGYGIYIDWMM